MAYDGILMRACARELNEILAGGRVDRITQPNRHEIILHIRSQSKTYKLLLSALAQEARVQIVSAAAPNPDKPPLFCMVLRKYLENGRILSFEQKGLDRILTLRIQAADEMGDQRERLLIAEIMGKHSNIILAEPAKAGPGGSKPAGMAFEIKGTGRAMDAGEAKSAGEAKGTGEAKSAGEAKDTGETKASGDQGLWSKPCRIIDSLHRVPTSVSRYRQVLPGEPYLFPPAQHKLPLWEETPEAMAPRLMAAGISRPLDKVILQTYDGLGPLSAQELIHRAGFSPVDTLEYFGQREYLQLFSAINDLGRELLCHTYKPEILLLDDKPKDFSAIALTQFPENRRQTFPSVNAMLEEYFKGRGIVNLFRQKQADLEQIVRREQERCRKKAGLQAASIQEAEAAKSWQLYGQLLMANHYCLEQGPEALVEDYTQEGCPEIPIPLDPQLSIIDNAQQYFSRYQKARNTAEKARVHYEETLAELEYLDSLSNSLTTVTSLEELAEIRGELWEAGYVKSEGKDPSGARPKPFSPKGPSGGPGKPGKGGKYNKKAKTGDKNSRTAGGGREETMTLGRETVEGFEVLYGKNNRQNDYLTMRLAKSGDLWLHAQKIPSSHVIIRNPEKKPVPRQVIEVAARICLAHSQAKTAGASIDYTQRQNVWKPKGAKPGMVLYENYQTLYLRPQDQNGSPLE